MEFSHTTTLRRLGGVIVLVLVFVLVVLDLAGAEALIQSTTELVLILVSVVGTIAFQLIIWPQRFLPQPTQKPTSLPQSSKASDRGLDRQAFPPPVSSFTPEQERMLLKLGFHSQIQRQLTEIWKRLDVENPKPVQFKAWSDFHEDVRKQYIDDLRTYETIEKIAKVVDTWNEAVNRASLLRVQPNSGTIFLCIKSFSEYHGDLKQLGFLI
jgi:hypothetical protein